MRFTAAILALRSRLPLYARSSQAGQPEFFLLDQEVQAGQQEAAKVDKQMPIVTTPL